MRRPLGIMTDPLLRSGKFQLDHALDLRRFLEMVQLVRLNPPGSGLHQEFGVVIPVVKEGIEGQAHIGPLLVDLGVADSNDFLFQACTHNQIFNDGGFSRTTTSTFPVMQRIDDVSAPFPALCHVKSGIGLSKKGDIHGTPRQSHAWCLIDARDSMPSSGSAR